MQVTNGLPPQEGLRPGKSSISIWSWGVVPNVVPRGTFGQSRMSAFIGAINVPRGTSQSVETRFGSSTKMVRVEQKHKIDPFGRVVFHRQAGLAASEPQPSTSNQNSFPTGVCPEFEGRRFERFPQPRPVSHNASGSARPSFSRYSGRPWERSSESSTKRAE